MTITDITPEPEGALRRAYNKWFKRSEPEPELTYGQVIEPWKPQESDELEPLAWVQRHALTLPDKRRVKARSKEVAKALPGMVLKFTFWTMPFWVWEDSIQPLARGCGKCARSCHSWVTAGYLVEAAQSAEGNQKAKHLENREKYRGYRLWSLVLVVCTLAGSMTYLYFFYFMPFLIVLGVILFLIHVLGRHGEEKKTDPTTVPVPSLDEAMEYGAFTKNVQLGLNEIMGFNDKGDPQALVNGLVTYDWDRGEFRQLIKTYLDFKDEHIRYLERRVQAKPNTLRILQDPNVSTQRIMVIKYKDPFANVPTAPWIPPKTKSITEGCLLGASQTERPFLLHLAGVHVGVIAQSKGGKSEGIIASIIDAILATHNAVCVGIDLSGGPLFPIYRECIQKMAYTPEEADELLDWLVEEKQRRAKILRDIAASRDVNVKGRQWNADLAVKYNAPSIHIIIDELAMATKFDGSKDAQGINLRWRIEEFARTGAKHWMTLVTGQQKTGNKDSGTTGVSDNMHIWLVGPCSQDDANYIFTANLRNAGWAPNLLKSATDAAPNDAGRCYVKAPGFGPDIYASWRPLPEDELKHRMNMRLDAGIPILKPCGSPDNEVVDADWVPHRPVLEALAAAFDDLNPPDGRLPSEMAVSWINERTSMEYTQVTLAAALKAELGDKAPRTATQRCKLYKNGDSAVKHYAQADIDALMAGS
jgi:hypothetical protein